jgi:hypothetical protein
MDDIALAPVDNPPPAPVAAVDKPRSAGQSLIDRFTDQSVRLQAIRQRLEAVRGVIDGGRVALDPDAGAKSKPRPTSYFEGMSLIADFNDGVMDGLDKAVAELEALF